MRAIILAGGFGTRLQPVLEPDMPKCMAPVMGRPMVDLIIRNLRKQNINDITLALHYQADKFIRYFGDKVKYKIENEPLGTGGAIKNCLCPEESEPVLIMNGDTIHDINYSDMLANHAGALTIAAAQKNGIITSAGTYIADPKLFDNYKGAFSFEQNVIPNTLKKFYFIPWFTDLGTPEEYLATPKDWD